MSDPIAKDLAFAEDSNLSKSDACVTAKVVAEVVVDQDAAGFTDPTLVLSREEDTRLRRRIHLRVLPFLCLGYIVQGLDKGTLTSSSIMGWQIDVGAKGQDFSLTTTMLWCGIIIAEPFANQGMRRFPIAKLLASGMLIWTGLVFGLAFSKSIPPVLGIRFLLGLSEALVGPCLVAIMVQWYSIDEQPLVTSVWQCMLGLSNIIASLLAYGFYHIHGGSLKSWQWLHIAVAIISLACAVLVFFFLPDSPTRAGWASHEDKIKFVERIRGNNQGLRQKVLNKQQMREAFTDPLTYCMFFLPFFNTLVVGGVSTFGGLLITKAFGFSTLNAQLLNLPVGVLQMICFLGIGWLIRRSGQTLLLMIAFTVPNICGTIVLLTVAPNGKTKGGLVAAYYCMQIYGACYPAILMLLSRNVAGQTKKSVVYAITFMGWAGGNGISPQIFQSVWAPRYINSLYIHIVLYVCFMSTCLITRTILIRRNKVKHAFAASIAEAVDPRDVIQNSHAFEDLTDRQNPDFIYSI
ncbi:putative MFS transporter [Naematelia encephala]|uniref:Putative MFS transporter n=1 Tax=Naematelia encephala TaxID=71784 RepID=A0A1Y2BJY4_9TREE|nr:putative MFS transporter [Naematelia encephala]